MLEKLHLELEKIQDKAQQEKFHIFYRKYMNGYFKRLNKVIHGLKEKHEQLMKIQSAIEQNEKELLIAKTLIHEKGLTEEYEEKIKN
jgi:superoxide dismutase